MPLRPDKDFLLSKVYGRRSLLGRVQRGEGSPGKTTGYAVDDYVDLGEAHTEDCPNQPGTGYVLAPIDCPECGTSGWHPTDECSECGHKLCWCVVE